MKRFLSLLVILTILLSLTACGPGLDVESNPPTPTEEEITTQPTTNQDTETKPEENKKPQMPTKINEVYFDGKIVLVGETKESDIKKNNWKLEDEPWAYMNNIASFQGSIAKDSNGKEFGLTVADKIIKCITVQDESTHDHMFILGLRVGMDESDAVKIIERFLPETVGSDYVIHDDEFTLIISTFDSKVKSIAVLENKHFNVFQPIEGNEHPADSTYKSNLELNPFDEDWAVATIAVNTQDDLSEIILDGKKLDFNQLKTSAIYQAGYTREDGYDMYSVEYAKVLRMFKNADGATIEFAHDLETYDVTIVQVDAIPPEGDILYDPNNSQIDCVFYKGIKPGMKKDDLIAAIANEAIDIQDSGMVYIKSETLTLSIKMYKGAVDQISIIKNSAFPQQ